jgi:hypothetical protein
MSHIAAPTSHRSRPSSLGARLWFLWMVGLWAAFFVLLFADRLGTLWNAVLHLPLLVEIVLWVLLLPWMLGMAVWTSSWSDWLRVTLVLLFAIGWTIASIPRRRS